MCGNVRMLIIISREKGGQTTPIINRHFVIEKEREREIMISSTSFSSDLSKLSQDAQLTSSVTVGTKKKTKKKIGFLTLNKPTSSSHSGSSKAPKLNSTDVKSKQQLPSLKSSTMPRPPKPPPTTKLVPPPSAGGATPPTSKKVLSFSLSKRNSPLSGKTEQVKPVKNRYCY